MRAASLPRRILGAALGLGLCAPAVAQPVAGTVSTAQPAGAACPPGGKFVDDAFAPTPAFPQQTRAPRPPPATGYKVERLVSDVAKGRTLAMLPDGRVLLAELGGRIRIIGPGGVVGPPIAGGPQIPVPSTMVGIQDIALDPAFAQNRTLYLSYGTLKPGQPAQAGFGAPPEAIGHVAKAVLSPAGDRLEGLTELYQGAPVRRLAVPADGTLFVSTTAGGPPAQSMDDDAGKVLRMRTDGAVPADNPFANRSGAGRLIYALGFRDPDGMTLDGEGRLRTIEHGPRGGDELNLIQAGRNYGFSQISYGRTYAAAPINGGLTAKAGMEQPVYFWTPSVAPSGLMVYSGRMFPQWKGNIFLGSLVAESLIRLTVQADKVVGEEFMLSQRCARVRDVREAPDGSIYVLTDAPAGDVLRLTRG